MSSRSRPPVLPKVNNLNWPHARKQTATGNLEQRDCVAFGEVIGGPTTALHCRITSETAAGLLI